MAVTQTDEEMIELIADHYGKENQLQKMNEELQELDFALDRYINLFVYEPNLYSIHEKVTAADNLIEEMADVDIMIKQILYLLGGDADTEFEHIRDGKLRRQLGRIEDASTEDNT